jgi:hypothetical protein
MGPVVLTRARDRIPKKVYIRATEYPNAGFDAGLSETRKQGWDTHEVRSGHDVMIDAPTQLAEILDRSA